MTEKRQFTNVWLSDESHTKSLVKWISFVDCGNLNIGPERLTFQGKNNALSIKYITQIGLVRQKYPWLSSIVLHGTLLTLYLFALLISLHLFADQSSRLSLFTIFCLIQILPTSLGVAMFLGTKWVEIEYKDEEDKICHIYLADGGWNGWSGILGGTKEIYQTLRAHFG